MKTYKNVSKKKKENCDRQIFETFSIIIFNNLFVPGMQSVLVFNVSISDPHFDSRTVTPRSPLSPLGIILVAASWTSLGVSTRYIPVPQKKKKKKQPRGSYHNKTIRAVL